MGCGTPQCKPSGVQSLPLVQGHSWGCIWPCVSCLSAPMSSNSSVFSGEALLLWDVDLLVARDLALDFYTEPQSHVPHSTAWCRWTWWPGQVTCPGAFQWHPHTCLESRLGRALRSDTCTSSRKRSRVPWGTCASNRMRVPPRRLQSVAVAHCPMPPMWGKKPRWLNCLQPSPCFASVLPLSTNTVLAGLFISHTWCLHTDGLSDLARVILFDFTCCRKAVAG